jgi:hypothetical protein
MVHQHHDDIHQDESRDDDDDEEDIDDEDDDDDDVDDADHDEGRETKKMSPMNNSHDESTTNNNDKGDDSRSIFSSCLSLLSRILFATGAGLQLWLSITYLGYYRHYEGIPFNVVVADDDATWMDHYEGTDGIPQNVLEGNDSTGGEALSAWYESTFWKDRDNTDDYIFQVIVGREGSNVSQIMAISFSASFCFLLTGLLDGCCLSTPRRRRLACCVVYGAMILASAFGIASACLLEKDKDLSVIFDMVSVHLFFIQAISLLLGCGSDNAHGCGRLTILAHLFFVLGTVGDVTLSYFYLFEQFEVWHSYMSIGSSSSWCLAALIYGLVALSVCCCGNKRARTIDGGRRSVTDGSDDPEEDDEEVRGEDDGSSSSSDDEYQGGINAYLKRQSQQQKQQTVSAMDPPDNDDAASITSFWTAGPGPENEKDIARSSLDAIFGRNTNSTKSESYD